MDNPFSWNKNANVIYLEQPAGVGFSTAAKEVGYSTGDNETALENYQFLEGFFEEFPQYAQNDLWVTGESYGGVYIPTLTYNILTGTSTQLRASLKGIMIGNPIIYCAGWKDTFFTIQLELYFWHGLISFSNRQEWFKQGKEGLFERTLVHALMQNVTWTSLRTVRRCTKAGWQTSGLSILITCILTSALGTEPWTSQKLLPSVFL